MKRLGRITAIALTAALPGPASAEFEETSARALATARQQVDELTLALSSTDMMDRMLAVKGLAAMIESGDGLIPGEIRALLETARADSDRNIAHQAEVGLAAMDGIDLIGPEVRAAHRLLMERKQMDELGAALDSSEMTERLSAVKSLGALASLADDTLDRGPVVALLGAARSDSDGNVAYQAEVELAAMDGIDLMAPEVLAAHRLSIERGQVDELEAALGATEMIERMTAVNSLATLANLAKDTLEPDRVLSLLRAALADSDWSVAEQARVALETWSSRREASP